MKDSSRFVKECVIRAVSDDYEEFERVFADVTGWAAERGIVIDRQGVLSALEGAIAEGYASAYVLSGTPPYSTPVEYSAALLDDLWFYVTPKGKHLARDLSC
ncbi:MAG TPA: hypothetical protein VFZ27_08245 [Terriglobia bacterium]|nr:hypothetical protein [Terriglobia bacterium]